MLTAGINSYEKKMGTMPRDGNPQHFTHQKQHSIIDSRAGFPVLYTSFHFPPLHGERSLRFTIPMAYIWSAFYRWCFNESFY